MTKEDIKYREENLLLLNWLRQIEAIIKEMQDCEYNFDYFFTNNLSIDIVIHLEKISNKINEVIDSSELDEALRERHIFEWQKLSKRIDEIESFLKLKFKI